MHHIAIYLFQSLAILLLMLSRVSFRIDRLMRQMLKETLRQERHLEVQLLKLDVVYKAVTELNFEEKCLSELLLLSELSQNQSEQVLADLLKSGCCLF